MAGPFHCKRGRSRSTAKYFVLLFSCCWTRALNLELMDSASTESCVLAFLRHCNVFGFPRYVNSDRGGNLVGAARHLREQWEVVENELKRKALDWPEIVWKFNPPYSPRFTGHVEIMVKIMKTNLRKILGQPKYLFREEELQTVLKIAQGYANMRPLTEVSSDPCDPPALTPSDFLLTGSRFLGGLPEVGFESYEGKTRKEMMGAVTREIWGMFTEEYVLAMQKVQKQRGEREFKVGEVVMILDKKLPSGRYCLGRIESAQDGPDGKARTFKVAHKGEILDRSHMTLAPLELL